MRKEGGGFHCRSRRGIVIVNDPFGQKLKDLGFELPHWCEPPSEELVADFEARLSVMLPPDYREVIVLRHFTGLSYEEIGDALGIPAKTVKSRLHTAKERLAPMLLAWEART